MFNIKTRAILAAMIVLVVTQFFINIAQADQTIVEHVEVAQKLTETAGQVAEKVPGLKDTAEGMLVSLINKATQAGEFVADQIPIVIKELLLFNAVNIGLHTFLGLAIMLTGVPSWRWASKYYKSLPETSQYDVGPSPWIPSCLLIVFGIWIFWAWVDDFLKIVFAPRVWLLEYAASLVK
jgi:hypothetical protein